MRQSVTILVPLFLGVALLARAPDCSTALNHNHDHLRDAEIVILSWEDCTVIGTINDVGVMLFMDVADCPLHAKVPGTFRIRYDVTCGAILEITDGPSISTAMPLSCPTPTPEPTPSPSPTPECLRFNRRGKCVKWRA